MAYHRHLTEYYTEDDYGDIMGSHIKIIWNSRFIDIGRRDISIIPPDDLP